MMLKWLKRLIHQNYKDMQGANKGLRRMHNKLLFARLDADIYRKQVEYWKALYAKVKQGGTQEAQGEVLADMPPPSSGSYFNDGTGASFTRSAPDVPILYATDSVEIPVNRPQDAEVQRRHQR
jgi:hypothetical protein